ncbi:hypothetical protein ETU08_10165 [Apibacter muscae]|uniref:hypothetical protein n=1 Tax=Apibacter muscae TaxID=2509004 RepID=UPI0011AC624F|nr:hypothetical protein [Apibacter muscae]TWP28069.1 hypothetical protein ETU08_10165 [Apibacter muscae]
MNIFLKMIRVFKDSKFKISENFSLHFINIETYSSDLINLIKSEIVKVWDGDLSEYELSLVKNQIKRFFKEKTENQNYGFVAEFICHLYLRYIGFQQYSVLKNLEEIKAPKKGFDGLYEKDGIVWLIESKSASPNRKTFVTHKNKVAEAYRDLKDKLEKNTSDENKNNPWENAKSHFLYTQKKDDSIFKHINRLSISYEKQDIMKIDDFNVIPCSTIYLDKDYCEINNVELEKSLKSLLNRYKAKNMSVLCINKKDIKCFINFIYE